MLSRPYLKLAATTLLAFSLALFTLGCDDGRPPSTQNITIDTLPEGEQYRDKLAPSGNVNWTLAPGPNGECKADAGAVQAVKQAANDMSGEIARVDFAKLSLPRFVTVTQKLKLGTDSWKAAEVEIDACGSEGGTAKWQIYGVRGQEIEQHPDLPIVHRWPHVYTLYDVQDRTVRKLLVTIRGYVLE